MLPKIKDIILSDKYDVENRDGGYFDIATIEEMMLEYGRLVRDRTLEWAAGNADGMQLNKHSILGGKTSKDLEILW